MSEDLLITVTGRDRPGITAALSRVLESAGVALLDVEQVVVQGRLTLCFSVRGGEAGLPEALRREAQGLGVHLEVETAPGGPPPAGGAARFVITMLGRTLGPGELHVVSAALLAHGASVDRIAGLSSGPVAAIELHAILPAERDPSALKRSLLEAASARGFDVALQHESVYRRSKRLVVMDMDSTLIRIEVIDELARAYGVVERVSEITDRAMAGEMDYDESLRQRVALLAGLDVAVLERIAGALPLTEGAETLVQVLRRLGYRTAVVSGGFSVAAQALKQRLGLDHAYSNVLEVKDGKLTGRVVGPIVNGARKAELLEQIARDEGVLLDQVIAVGDGANDIPMLQRAGLGIAFRARARLREAAHSSISAAGLDAILYLLGLSERELAQLR